MTTVSQLYDDQVLKNNPNFEKEWIYLTLESPEGVDLDMKVTFGRGERENKPQNKQAKAIQRLLLMYYRKEMGKV
jgi:hypothetical protein